MKILIADPFEQSGLDALIELGCRTSYQPDLRDDLLTSAIVESGAEVLVVRSTRVTREMIEAGVTGGRLSLVVRAGAGYNTIDVAAASACGVFVANCPGKNSIAVAELAACTSAVVGINDNFMRELGETLPRGSAALCLLIREATADRVVERLRVHAPHAKLLRSNLSHTDEEQLRELLERAARQAEALRLS